MSIIHQVPVLVDGDNVVSDSWEIACYLEETYPEGPSLFGSELGRGAIAFIKAWTAGPVNSERLLPAVLLYHRRKDTCVCVRV